MTKSQLSPYDPRHEEDQSPLAGLVAEGEKIGNIKDPDVAAEVQNAKDWNNWIDSGMKGWDTTTPFSSAFEELSIFARYKKYWSSGYGDKFSDLYSNLDHDGPEWEEFAEAVEGIKAQYLAGFSTGHIIQTHRDLAEGRVKEILVAVSVPRLQTWDFDQIEKDIQSAFDGDLDD